MISLSAFQFLGIYFFSVFIEADDFSRNRNGEVLPFLCDQSKTLWITRKELIGGVATATGVDLAGVFGARGLVVNIDYRAVTALFHIIGFGPEG